MAEEHGKSSAREFFELAAKLREFNMDSQDSTMADPRQYLQVIFTGVGEARRTQIVLIRINDMHAGIAMRTRQWVHRAWLDAVLRTGQIRAVVLQEADKVPQ